MSVIVAPQNMIYQPLSTDGVGTTNVAAIGDYSDVGLGLTQFYIQPKGADADRTYIIHRLIVHVQDTGSFDAEKYGNNITLTNGLKIYVRNGGPTGGTVLNVTAPLEPIQHNADWTAYCFDADVKDWGIGDEVLTARWTFSKSGSPLRLKGSLKQALVIDLNDDFSGLVEHKFMIQGYKL